MADAKIKDLKWLLDKLGDSKVKSINFEHDGDWYVYEYDVLIVDINDAINGQTKNLRLLGGVIAHYFKKFLSLKEIEALSVDPDLTGKQARLCYKQAGEVWKDKENKERKLALKINDNLLVHPIFRSIRCELYDNIPDWYIELIEKAKSTSWLMPIAKNINCPPEILDKIVDEIDIGGNTEGVVEAAINNENYIFNLDKIKQWLSSTESDVVQKGLTILELKKSQYLMVLEDSSCPKKILEKTAQGDDVELKQAVLKNSALSADIVLGCTKSESIGSELITVIAERSDLDDVTREIVDLKVKLAELRTQHKEDSGYAWLEESLLSITGWGKDIFEALHRDDDEHIRSAVAKNPSLPEEMLSELIEDSESVVKLSALANPSCTKTILKKASEDTENYSSSRVRKAVALNPNIPKDLINKLIKDEYRWVREAASSHESVKDKEISDLVKSGDRYILKGLLENPHCTDGIKKEITKKLEDENKYPIETGTYIIENGGCGEYTGGSMTVEEMADEIVESDGSSLPGEYYQYEDLYHCFGNYDLKEEILLPDGTSEKLNLTLETDITDCGADFVMCAASSESGEVGNYEIELEELFEPSKVMAIEEYGLVEGYEYGGYTRFDGESAGESIPGDGYSLPSLDIQVKAGDDYYETFYIEDEISEMEENGVDVSDAKAVLKFLKETYSL